MDFAESYKNSVFSLQPHHFDEWALKLFHFQAAKNEVYKSYLNFLNVKASDIKTIGEIPFLPIEVFKEHKVVVGNPQIEKVFASSGTTGSTTSRHYIPDLKLYEESLLQCFHLFYGKPSDYIFLALLPSYLERSNASLVYMADVLIKESGHSSSGFFKDDLENLLSVIEREKVSSRTIFLLGVSFALLDLAEQYKPDLGGTIVMETGGMKGRRKEMIREELHRALKAGLKVAAIHSEYGMTELLSQAYSRGDGLFRYPPWMRVLIRDPYDPFALLPAGEAGAINIIDLANLHSCGFIATSDIGRVYTDGSFQVLGRLDNSDIRGCNLMVL